MANKVTFDYSKAAGFVQEHEMAYMSELVAQAKEKLVAKSGAGNDFLGWIDLPVDYDKEEFERIKKAAAKIQSDSEVLVVIGMRTLWTIPMLTTAVTAQCRTIQPRPRSWPPLCCW